MQAGEVQAIPATEHVYRYTLRSPRVLIGWLVASPLFLVTLFALSGLLPPHRFHLNPFSAVGGLAVMCIGAALSTSGDGAHRHPRGRRLSAILPVYLGALAGHRGDTAMVARLLRLGMRRRVGDPRRRPVSARIVATADLRAPLHPAWSHFAPRWRDSPLGEDIRRMHPGC